ncbi:MAG: ATP-binding protein, partial [Gammaproteobacteria bacterium]|nr:ATP-binding protein [Gammaproteobacteria bacterium]
ESILLLAPEARKSKVKVELNLDRTLGKIPLQTIQIQQVLLNLAYNAIEAMNEAEPEHRQLTIETAAAGNNAVTITVADSGPGLSSEVKESLFNPFITTKSSGMGLGLSISKGIIDMHNGSLFLDSSSESGTVFRFTLPLKPEGKQI